MNRTMGRKLWGVVDALGLVLTTGAIAIPTKQAVKVEAAPPLSPTDNSRVPHYFGPYSNWANSPQVLTDATVTITPQTGDSTGAGAQATATVDLITGAVTAYTVTNPGSGYTLAPDVTVAGAGTLATATAAFTTGLVSTITVTSQQNFVDPEVTIAPPIAGATASAVASGGVGSITLLDGGRGYSIEPIVVIGQPNLTDPGGVPAVQATATAVMVAGVLTGITLQNQGSGYTSAPTITINDVE